MHKPRSWESYLSSLGEFTHEFAKTEACVKDLFYETIGMRGPMARALFKDTRMGAARELIKNARTVKDIPKCPLLDRAFAQLELITGVRNMILHYEPELFGAGEFSICNQDGKMPGSESTIILNEENLQWMVSDLKQIRSLILSSRTGSSHPNANAPWHFRESMIAQPRKQGRDSRQK